MVVDVYRSDAIYLSVVTICLKPSLSKKLRMKSKTHRSSLKCHATQRTTRSSQTFVLLQPQ